MDVRVDAEGATPLVESGDGFACELSGIAHKTFRVRFEPLGGLVRVEGRLQGRSPEGRAFWPVSIVVREEDALGLTVALAVALGVKLHNWIPPLPNAEESSRPTPAA